MNINEKKLNGIVYTPKWIVHLILDNLGYKENICDKKIIDPACGEGAFLSGVVDRFIIDAKNKNIDNTEIKEALEKNIFGFDIDESAIEKCVAILDEIAIKYNLKNIKWQILKTDSLDKNFVSRYFDSFDFVVGNPPYIRIQHLGIERRHKIQSDWQLCKKGSTDIFITFFELGYYLLNKTGKLGYITPNTYLKTKAGKVLRDFIKASQSLKVLIDFEHHQLFDNATTYSLITILDKNYQQNTFALYKGNAENVSFIDNIDIENLNIDNWILTSNDILKRLKTIERRGLPLGKIAEIHVGITTLADDFYIFRKPKFDGDYAQITLKDGRIFQIEKSILKPIIKASVLKDSNENQERYVIFPYRKINDKHVIISENELKNEFPMTYRYFLAIKDRLDKRDKGKPNPVAWYAFGRSQGLDTSFGKKILTSPINLKPKFIVWEKEGFTFYAGYCIKYDGDLKVLAEYLNSSDMEFYINNISRDYQSNYKSFAKSFIEKFGISDLDLIETQKQISLQI
ncbi:TPA: N-6 DNA methylase [bacterium]|nr:N-6 DNA methylase [bacterium]